jgi:glycosyltransferase involved in cell wall biosynthesis
MRILDVSPRVTLPLSSGSRIRMYNLLSRISKGNEIRQFSQTRTRDLRRPGFATEVQITPSYREHRYQSSVGSSLCEVMERTGFGVPILCGYPLRAARPRRLREWVDWADVVVVEFPWQYGCCRSMSKCKPVVLATHNVQAAKVRSGGSGGVMGRIWGAWTEALERQAVRGADLVLAVSLEDREEFARRYGVDPRKISVIPNGADVDLYRPADEATRAALRRRLGLPAGPTVIFPAPHRQTPILEGLKWVGRVAARLPQVTFLITGAVEKPRAEGNLLFTGFVEEYDSYLRSADCLLCPIDRGGGTKLKLIESAAAGLPIAAFAESVRGTTFRSGDHLLVVDKSVSAIAMGLRRLLEERDTARRLGASARAHAVEHYDWGAIAQTMESALMGLIEAKRCRPA